MFTQENNQIYKLVTLNMLLARVKKRDPAKTGAEARIMRKEVFIVFFYVVHAKFRGIQVCVKENVFPLFSSYPGLKQIKASCVVLFYEHLLYIIQVVMNL